MVKKFDVPQLELLGDGPDDRGVRMAQAVDGDACQQVDVLLTVGVPDMGAPDQVGRGYRKCS